MMSRMANVVSASANRPEPQTSPRNRDKDKNSDCQDKIEACMKGKPFQLAKPLVISMSLFGLLFLNCKTSKWFRITKAYSIFVLILLWASVIQLFFAYRDEQFGVRTFFKIIKHVWYIQSGVNATVTYKACNCESRFTEFLLKWSRLLKTNRGSPPDDPGLCPLKYERHARRIFNLYLVLGWVILVIGSFSNGYFLFASNLTDFAIAPVLSDHPFAIPMKVIINVANIYRSATWAFTPILFLFISSVIYKEFEIFHCDLRKAISPDGDIADVEMFRQRHQDICRMVETADDVLSAFNAAGIVFSVIDGMFLLYSLVWDEFATLDPILLTSRCFWLFGVFFYLLLIGYGGGYLNHMAHAPLKTIHNIAVKDTCPEFSLQMNMFLNKLSGDPIGLTALDMFVIDKPTILTIAGAFITYFIVLIQFQQPTNSGRMALSNCTELFANCTIQCPSLSVAG